ncbi:MAG: protein kinase, partial [Candidatus Aerophobus sp.]
CGMYDLGEEKGTHYITMEYVPGEDLKGMIRMMGQLGAGKAISVAKQICEGLAEAHRLGVVHRDLKPSNIMIDKDGNSRIMDFGIARSIKGKGITGAGIMVGTPEYMSPEQVEGKQADQRSDVYSLGVILYEMVTGRVPFEGDTPLVIAVKHKAETPQDPKELNAQLPSELSSLILRCLEKDKEKRFQKAEEVLSELEKIEKGIPTEERIVPERKPITSKEITVSFNLKKLSILAIAIIAVLCAVIIIWKPWSKPVIPPGEADIPSIAVLPFEDLSEQKDQAYICDGLAEELINRLTNIGSVRVPARTSTFSLKDKGFGISEIAKKLNVEMILEGSLRKAGKKLRIQVQLVNAASGFPVWSEKYERDEEDIFVLQDEISLEIVDKLKVKLLGEEKNKLVKRHTESPEAYNLYLQGRWFLGRREIGFKNAIESFEKAIKIDPGFALAYVGLADSYYIAALYGFIPKEEAFLKGESMVAKALELDDKLGEAHSTLGMIKSVHGDRKGAEEEFKHAIELNQNYPSVHHQYSYLLSSLGRHKEAISEAKKALELDPLSPVMLRGLGMVYFHAREYDNALEMLNKALDFNPDSIPCYRLLFSVYQKKKMYRESITVLEEILSRIESKEFAKLIDKTYGESGYNEALRQAVNQPLQYAYLKAILLSMIGEREQAIEWLERVYKERVPAIGFLKVHPAFDNLRSHPKYKELLRKLGLEE